MVFCHHFTYFRGPGTLNPKHLSSEPGSASCLHHVRGSFKGAYRGYQGLCRDIKGYIGIYRGYVGIDRDR